MVFHVGEDLVVSKGLCPLLQPVNSAFICIWPETRTSPVLDAVFVAQMRVFDVELAQRLVDAIGRGSGCRLLTEVLIDIVDTFENERVMGEGSCWAVGKGLRSGRVQ